MLLAFDLLAHDGRSLLGQPLQARRGGFCSQDLLARTAGATAQFSEGIVGAGKVFFEQAVRQGQEGVMAKHLASRYLPGKRSHKADGLKNLLRAKPSKILVNSDFCQLRVLA